MRLGRSLFQNRLWLVISLLGCITSVLVVEPAKAQQVLPTKNISSTPIRDIPQSIQVIPQQVIEDQQATRLIEVLQNAPGVVQGGISPRSFLIPASRL